MARSGGWTGGQAAVYAGLALAALVNAGCLAAAVGVTAAGAGAAGYAYYKGAVYREYNAGITDTMSAAQAALADLGFPAKQWEPSSILLGSNFVLEGRTTAGEPVYVTVGAVDQPSPASGPLTRVGVRVGTFGDAALGERVLDQTGAHLVPGVAPLPPATSLPLTWAPAPGTPAPTVTPTAYTPQSPEPPLLDPAPRGR